MELMMLGLRKAATPTRVNWRKRRIRLTIDTNRGQRLCPAFELALLFDDGDDWVAFEFSSSMVWRRRTESNERRMMMRQIVDTARMMTSGKIRRKTRMASALSRLKIEKKINDHPTLFSYRSNPTYRRISVSSVPKTHRWASFVSSTNPSTYNCWVCDRKVSWTEEQIER